MTPKSTTNAGRRVPRWPWWLTFRHTHGNDQTASNVPFSFTFTPNDQLVLAEAGPSALHTFSLAPGGTLTSLSASLGVTARPRLSSGHPCGRLLLRSQRWEQHPERLHRSRQRYSFLVGSTGVVASTDAGPIDMTASASGQYLHSEAGGAGAVDEFQVNSDGSLSPPEVWPVWAPVSRGSPPTDASVSPPLWGFWTNPPQPKCGWAYRSGCAQPVAPRRGGTPGVAGQRSTLCPGRPRTSVGGGRASSSPELRLSVVVKQVVATSNLKPTSGPS